MSCWRSPGKAKRGQEGLSQPLLEDYPPWQQKALAYIELGRSVLRRHPCGGQVRSCPHKRHVHGKKVGRIKSFCIHAQIHHHRAGT